MQFSLNLFYPMHSRCICSKNVALVLRVSREEIFYFFVLLFFCPKNEINKELRYMKKTYVSPLMVEVNVEAESMLAASLQINSDKTVDTSNGGQLSGGSRGEWGNLWN